MMREIVYVDSPEEQVAYLIARFGPTGTWSVRDQQIAALDSGDAVERASLQTREGDIDLEFRDATRVKPSFTDPVDQRSRVGELDTVMERAATFAKANPPHHPGSLARFPVPVEHYGSSVGVPFPILAVDDKGHRGLYAPPRMVVIDWDTFEPVGAREVEGFDPNIWPPRRLGDWPSPGVSCLTHEQLGAMIRRFSACWSRVIDAWFHDPYGRGEVLTTDAREAMRWRSVLDLEAMVSIYRTLNPRFDDWVRILVGAAAEAS
jgi:hypothetical protein